jgi:hypothetical protein
MMSNIQRWTIALTVEGLGKAMGSISHLTDSNGEWCKWADVANLEAEIAALRPAIEAAVARDILKDAEKYLPVGSRYYMSVYDAVCVRLAGKGAAKP